MDRGRLSHVLLLRACSPVQLDGVLARSGEVSLGAGEPLFEPDDVVDAVWVLLDGELEIAQDAEGGEIVVEHLGAGAFVGEVSMLTRAAAGHRARATTPSHLVRIPSDAFHDLLGSCREVSEVVLRTMAERVRRSALLLRKRERMASLGTLAAGLAHELNNPASAAKRASALLREHLDALAPLARRLARRNWTAEEVALLEQLEASTARGEPGAPELDGLARSDREESVGQWLERNGIDQPWTLAPVLVDRGLTAEALERVRCDCNPAAVSDALEWSGRITAVRQLAEEVGESTLRIAQVVKAVKAFSYTDTSTIRSADIHESIEHSLTILGHKLRDAHATVVREFDRTLPPVETYGTELGQVWINLIDNAADAVAANAPPGGVVRVRTSRAPDGIVVEIVDTGPGIDPDVAKKIFEPFFTTKEAGQGTGLGLEIVKRIVSRHRGTLNVDSRLSSGAEPGEARFVVRLPFVQPSVPPADGERGDGAGRRPSATEGGAAAPTASTQAPESPS